ncbi:hypothetical protein AQZ52_09760 [Novosphingobium fuchskuhlense]|uniref:Uncharacterized protein n=1 Tax=Novosphingobium fuchskuhlense TaxID=1117702 RepID=A0A117UVY6_9SPHN|nr:hypothetical protein AQZ52_09760 [Novosphingobium fuchskuhlense]
MSVDQKLATDLGAIVPEQLCLYKANVICPSDHEPAVAKACYGGVNLIAGRLRVDQKLSADFVNYKHDHQIPG